MGLAKAVAQFSYGFFSQIKSELQNALFRSIK